MGYIGNGVTLNSNTFNDTNGPPARPQMPGFEYSWVVMPDGNRVPATLESLFREVCEMQLTLLDLCDQMRTLKNPEHLLHEAASNATASQVILRSVMEQSSNVDKMLLTLGKFAEEMQVGAGDLLSPSLRMLLSDILTQRNLVGRAAKVAKEGEDELPF